MQLLFPDSAGGPSQLPQKRLPAGDRRLNANNLAETNPVNTPAVRHEFLTISDLENVQRTKLLKQRAGLLEAGQKFSGGQNKNGNTLRRQGMPQPASCAHMRLHGYSKVKKLARLLMDNSRTVCRRVFLILFRKISGIRGPFCASHRVIGLAAIAALCFVICFSAPRRIGLPFRWRPGPNRKTGL